uniref:Uncharacterized protein n=1 Tax=Peronospora matthiolae TaxID=2874970 RepID=A0AAV1U4Y3_9STRA
MTPCEPLPPGGGDDPNITPALDAAPPRLFRSRRRARGRHPGPSYSYGKGGWVGHRRVGSIPAPEAIQPFDRARRVRSSAMCLVKKACGSIIQAGMFR